MKTLTSSNKNLTLQELARMEVRISYPKSGCWLLNGYKDRDGYGQIVFRRKLRRAHRVIWFAVNGIIGTEWFLDHKCRVRHCVNPQHLRKVTPKQNSLENSKSLGAINASKTHCKRGHVFNRKYGGQRYCSICQAEKTKRLREKWNKEPLLVGV